MMRRLYEVALKRDPVKQSQQTKIVWDILLENEAFVGLTGKCTSTLHTRLRTVTLLAKITLFVRLDSRKPRQRILMRLSAYDDGCRARVSDR
jgi:hypothetical protein